MKTRATFKKPPFEIDRTKRGDLASQVADGLRAAIATGYYRPGDVLPPVRALSELLGVSMVVAVHAVDIVREEGLVSPRPRVGSVVRNLGRKLWRGHVVMVYPWGDDGYFQTMLIGALRDALAAAGYLFTQACVRIGPDGDHDFSLLDVALAHSADIVVSLYDYPGIFRHLSALGIPYAAVGHISAAPRGAVGFTHLDYNLVVPEFAAACAAAGVREVVEIYWNKKMSDIAPGFASSGIAVRKRKVFVDSSRGRILNVERPGRRAMELILAEGLPSRDTALFFSDDHLARGALTALSFAGLRAPEDVRVATWSNAGLGPDYPRELSRMEIDPVSGGRKVAGAVLEFLKTGKYPAGTVIGPKWLPGETMGFPQKAKAKRNY